MIFVETKNDCQCRQIFSGNNLTGFYKLYVDNKKIRIVYRLPGPGEEIEIIEVWDIGKRDKEEIYRLIGHRLKKKKS
jgi:hypothetical protein